jgi:hypothetical protein
MAVGGSVQSLTISGRNFAVAADSDVNRKLGGFENEMEANGDGTVREIKTRVPWALTDADVVIDDANEDQEFLQLHADSIGFVPITITMADGSIYQGSGKVTGENPMSAQSAKATIGIQGEGKLTKQG